MRAPAIVPLEEKVTMVGDLERFGVSSKNIGSAPFGNRNSAIQSLLRKEIISYGLYISRM